MKKRFYFFSACLVLLTGLLSFTFAQERTGSLEGTILDPQGAVISGAKVKVIGAGVNFSATTNDDGVFRFPSLPPGTYSIEASATNFSTVKQENNVVVTLGNKTFTKLTLQPGTIDATVTVTSDNLPQIDVTDSKAATNITAQQIERVPKSPNFSSVLKYSPSTRPEPNAGGFQVDGASGSENTFVIDGQEVTNFRTGTLNFNNNIPTEFIQEVQVKTGGFEAQFGGATGGVVNVVTKGGANKFTGQAGIQFFVADWQAAPPLIQSGSTTNLQYIATPAPRGTSFLPSINVSGPIVKDKAWFFVNHSPQFYPFDTLWTFQDGTQTLYESKVRQDYSFARIDSQLTNSLRVYGTYTYNPFKRNGIVPSSTSLFAAGTASRAPRAENQVQQGGRQPATAFTLAGTWTPTSNLVIDIRGGRSYLNQKLLNYGIPNQVRYRCITAGPQCGAFFSDIATNFLINKDISIRKTFDFDISYFVNDLFGTHNLKGGYQLNDISNDVDQGYVNTGEIRLFFGRTFPDLNGVPQGAGAGEVGYGYLQRFGTTGLAASKNQAIYAQDSWTIARRLTLNLGFRIEKENVPSFSDTGILLVFDWNDKFTPRLGFAWDVLGNGKFKVHGFWGRFFDRFKYELPRGSFGGDTFIRNYFVIDANNTSPFFYTREYALANAFRENNFRVPSNDPNDPTIDPDLKAVRQTEYSFGFEYGLTQNTVLAARYLRKNLDRTIEDVGIPDAAGNETYFIANPGFGIVNRIPEIISGVPATPKAIRQYDALEVRFDKRFSENIFFNANYTYSRLYGNYGGLASSDEGGRTSPNVNRVFDLPFEPFTASGEPNNGRLGTDRPHVLKFVGAYNFDWTNLFGYKINASKAHSTNFSLFTTIQSGTPVTSRVDLIDVATVVLNERGDLGRTEAFTQTDFAITHKYRFGRDNNYAIAFDLNILNIFNEHNELGRYELITGAIFAEGSGYTLLDTNNNPVFTQVFPSTRADSIRAIFSSQNGLRDEIQTILDAERQPNAVPAFAQDARYNQPNLFQTKRSIQFGFRFIF